MFLHCGVNTLTEVQEDKTRRVFLQSLVSYLRRHSVMQNYKILFLLKLLFLLFYKWFMSRKWATCGKVKLLETEAQISDLV